MLSLLTMSRVSLSIIISWLLSLDVFMRFCCCCQKLAYTPIVRLLMCGEVLCLVNRSETDVRLELHLYKETAFQSLGADLWQKGMRIFSLH